MFEVLKVPTLAVVENMSFFECEHGTRYYPFGRGGRQGLLQALNHATNYESEMNSSSSSSCGSSNGTKTSSSSNTSHGGLGELNERLKVCPLHCLPLSSDVSGCGHEQLSDDKTNSNNNHSNNNNTINNNHLRIPAVMRLPNDSPVSKIYASLANDVIIEIIKMQLNAQTIPSMTFIEGRGVIMRYYTASQAIQHVIPGVICLSYFTYSSFSLFSPSSSSCSCCSFSTFSPSTLAQYMYPPTPMNSIGDILPLPTPTILPYSSILFVKALSYTIIVFFLLQSTINHVSMPFDVFPSQR